MKKASRRLAPWEAIIGAEVTAVNSTTSLDADYGHHLGGL